VKTAARLAPTLVACVALLTGFIALVNAMTDGFDRWTFEDMRRAKALRGELAATPLEVRGADGTRSVLWPRTASDRDVVLVGFIYTRCRTVCLALGSEFTRMQQVIAEAPAAPGGRVRLVSLSIDMDHETPASLASYARLHGASADSWSVMMPASPAEAARLLGELGVVAVPDGLGGFVHNGSIHVMTDRGRVLGIHDDADWREALASATSYVGTGSP
jgi:protein SCO1/2